jgi:hypothetical protein
MSHSGNKQIIYEINTWVWLTELSTRYGQPITLASVPDEALDAIALPGIDAIWLMGIWQRSDYAHQISMKWKEQYRSALPDMTDDDVVASAYAIGDYRVNDAFGGREALASLRARLAQRGLKLILDFVPNHVGADHHWLNTHPDYIVQGTVQDLATRPSDFFAHVSPTGERRIFAHGRDPYFPGWSDTAQLNIFSNGLRAAIRDVLLDIASQCDGIRCDMAMLMMRSIFATTWQQHVGPAPSKEYWIEMIGAVRAQYPQFMFIAEVYWGKEYELLLQGFDYCYDKVFYDRVESGDVQRLRQHLVSELAYQQRLLRFLENHDEPRSYETLGPRRVLPASTLLLTLPGATLLHQGQLEGRRAKLPVQIRRAPAETHHPGLREHYLRLLRATDIPLFRDGNFYLFIVNPARARSQSYLNLLAYGWHQPSTGDFRLVVVNTTDKRSQGRIDLSPWTWLIGRHWHLYNTMDGEEFSRQGGAMTREGMFIDVDPYESLILRFELEEEAMMLRPTGGHHSEVF